LFNDIEKINNYMIIKLKFIERYQDNVAKFAGEFSFNNPGLQHFSLRIVPANKFIRINYPNLVKWKE